MLLSRGLCRVSKRVWDRDRRHDTVRADRFRDRHDRADVNGRQAGPLSKDLESGLMDKFAGNFRMLGQVDVSAIKEKTQMLTEEDSCAQGPGI